MALWIADNSGDEVFEFADPTDLTTSTRRDLPATLTSPLGLSFDSQGHMWIVDSDGAEVFEFADPTDLTVFVRRDLPTTLTIPQGLSFDSQGHMWISDSSGDEVFEFADPTDLTVSIRRNLPATLDTPQGLSFDSQGHMWISDSSGDEVFEFADPTDLTVFVRRDLPATLTIPLGLSFDSQGHMWIVDGGDDEVFEFADPTDLTVSIRRNLPATLANPNAVSFDDRLSPTPLDAAGTLDGGLAGSVDGAASLESLESLPLTLSDWDDTGLDVDFAALIEVEAAPDLYRDSDRGGTQSPIEGEIGLSTGETVISRLWWNGATFRFNDNDNPVALNIGVYYSSTGGGADASIYLVTGDADSQTEASFDAATYWPGSGLVGGGWVNWGAGTTPLTTDVIALLNGLSAGDRLIIASAEASGLAALDAEGTLDGELDGSLGGVASLLSPTPLDAAGALDGGLAGSLSGVASLESLNPINAAGTLDGGLAGSLSGFASLSALSTLDAAGTLDGGLAGSLAGAASLGLAPPLDAAGTLDGGLDGSVSGAASLGPVPLDAAGTLTGGLIGSLEADADVVDPPDPTTAMKAYLLRLRLPWSDIERRWGITCAIADVMQKPVDSAGVALRELWPATCRPETLAMWGAVLGLPQRAGETAAEWRRRLVRWRSEPVGTSGWILDEAKRITGVDPPRVIEFPRQGMRLGYDRLGSARLGGGPSLTVGVAPADRAELAAALEAGVPPDVGINYLEPAVFDAI